MQKSNLMNRQNQADRIVNSLKAKSHSYPLFATKKIKKIPKKYSKSHSKSSELLSQGSSNKVENKNLKSDLPWFQNEDGKVQYVTFTLHNSETPCEKNFLFSEMVKKIITEKYKPIPEPKTFYNRCFFDKEKNQIYLGNTAFDEKRFYIGNLRPDFSILPSKFLEEKEIENIFHKNQVSFLYN